MSNCLFCKVGKKEIASEVIYENDTTLAFLDVHPKAPGHTMVIPKNHAENILALEDKLAAPVLLTVKKVTGTLAKALRPDGFTIGINHGRAGGQVVDHLHIHIIPRFSGDGGKSLHSVVENPPTESLTAIAEKIRRAN